MALVEAADLQAEWAPRSDEQNSILDLCTAAVQHELWTVAARSFGRSNAEISPVGCLGGAPGWLHRTARTPEAQIHLPSALHALPCKRCVRPGQMLLLR